MDYQPAECVVYGFAFIVNQSHQIYATHTHMRVEMEKISGLEYVTLISNLIKYFTPKQ